MAWMLFTCGLNAFSMTRLGTACCPGMRISKDLVPDVCFSGHVGCSWRGRRWAEDATPTERALSCPLSRGL